MRSVFLCVAAVLLLVACQQNGDYVGKGPLVLSPKAVQTIHEYRHGSSGTHANLVLAEDRYSRYLGGGTCVASIRPTSSGGDDFGLDCRGGLQTGGRYSGSDNAIAGKGRATDGRIFNLTLDLKSGT